MSKSFMQEKYKLSRNPFPPAASGIDLEERESYIPSRWEEKLEEYYTILSKGVGVKAFPVTGDYGSGKTVLLKGYLKRFFEGKRIKTFYFENPGVQFYDLANTLMRSLGRYEFAKALWERCKEHLRPRNQLSLFPISFNDMLNELRTKRDRDSKALDLQGVIRNDLNLTDDEQVAHNFASMIVETAKWFQISFWTMTFENGILLS